MSKIRFAILGAGNIARKFCKAVELVEQAEVVAVASQTPGKAEVFAGDFGIEKSYTNYEEMLQESEFDVVYIATTHNYHFENVMLCLKYKKHILCEKPFVLTESDAKEAFDTAKAANCFVMEATWSRFLPAIQQARAWVESGAIGEIQMAHALIGFKAEYNPKGRMFNPDLAGGALYDIGVYAFEIMTYLIPQEIKEIQIMITKAETGVDKVDNVTLKFETCLANLQTIITSQCASEIRIHGTDGYIILDNPICAKKCTLYTKDKQETFVGEFENGFEYQIQEVIDCLAENKLESSVIPHKDTCACAALFDRCLNA